MLPHNPTPNPTNPLPLYSLLLSCRSPALFCLADGRFLSLTSFPASSTQLAEKSRDKIIAHQRHRWPRHWPTGSGGGWRGGGTISLLGCAQNPSRYEQTLLNHFANKRTSFIFFLFFFPMRRGCASVHCLNLSARGGLHPSIRPSVLLRLMRLFPLHCGSAAN